MVIFMGLVALKVDVIPYFSLAGLAIANLSLSMLRSSGN